MDVIDVEKGISNLNSNSIRGYLLFISFEKT